jgi:hypothetical protein
MKNRGTTKTESGDHRANEQPLKLEDQLIADYGDTLATDGLSEDQQKECLLALWQLMVAFVDLGFSVKAGDKFCENSDHGFDDVLRYLTLETTAPETVASPKPQEKQEQP